MDKEKSIIVALCRCAMANNPNNATKHQIQRLVDYYFDCDYDLSLRLHNILNPPPDEDTTDAKLVQSTTHTEAEAVEFGEWQRKQQNGGYIFWVVRDKMWRIAGYAPYYDPDDYLITTTQLYKIFKKEKENGNNNSTP